MRDRALQAMVKNALEPYWEARFECTSYGFRPGRSCHDAMEMIHKCGRVGTARPWIVDADIEGAFDHINHQYLLKTIGSFPGRGLIKEWLKAGYLEYGTFHPTWEGTPQGGVISPLLANIALHGMETALGIYWTRKSDKRRKSGHIWHNPTNRALVRYADDFVVFCRTEEDAKATLDTLRMWLGDRGLKLKEEKTRIVHLNEGFDFLGFTVRRYPTHVRSGEILLITPSKESTQTFRNRMRTEWLKLKGNDVHTVLKRLNPIIRGWGNYFRLCNASRTFHRLDSFMYLREVRYAKFMHPHKSKGWRAKRYFGQLHKERHDQWVFGNKATGAYLLKLGWLKVEHHIMVDGFATPDDPAFAEYWRVRMGRKLRNLTLSRQKIAWQQRGQCATCGDPLMNGEELQQHHIQHRAQGGKDRYDNLVLTHLYCHQQEHRTKT